MEQYKTYVAVVTWPDSPRPIVEIVSNKDEDFFTSATRAILMASKSQFPSIVATVKIEVGNPVAVYPRDKDVSLKELLDNIGRK